jgi:hypothetical protein
MFVIITQSYSTSALVDGDWVGWDIVTDKTGATVTKATGAVRGAVAGCSVGALAAGAVGKIQVWGYKSNAKCKGGSGSNTSKLTAGCALVMATGDLAIQALPRTATALKLPYAAKRAGVFIEPLNTAAKATSATTWRGEVFINCI